MLLTIAAAAKAGFTRQTRLSTFINCLSPVLGLWPLLCGLMNAVRMSWSRVLTLPEGDGSGPPTGTGDQNRLAADRGGQLHGMLGEQVGR